MRSLILLTLLLASCASLPQRPLDQPMVDFDHIDPAFNPIVQMFVYEAESRGHSVDLTNVKMKLGDAKSLTDNETVGYCVVDRLGALIIIHESAWAEMDEPQKENLLFHEMGHCLIGREHCGKQNKVGPISIMFPYIVYSEYYTEYREDLVDELFNIDSRCIDDDGTTAEEHGPVCSPSHLETTK